MGIWVARDKGAGNWYALSRSGMEMNSDGFWYSLGENANPELTFPKDIFEDFFDLTLKKGEKCYLDEGKFVWKSDINFLWNY